MDCQECHKRPATLHFTQVISGEKKQIHVCEECAKEKGYLTYPEDSYTFEDLLSGLFNYKFDTAGNHVSTSPNQQWEDLQCPQCHMTFSKFRRIGKFGCASCYETFADKLDPVFRRVHSGNTVHHGKIPKRKSKHLHVKREIETLQSELNKLIQEEAFEQAAEIRDKIHALKKQKLEESDPKEGDRE